MGLIRGWRIDGRRTLEMHDGFFFVRSALTHEASNEHGKGDVREEAKMGANVEQLSWSHPKEAGVARAQRARRTNMAQRSDGKFCKQNANNSFPRLCTYHGKEAKEKTKNETQRNKVQSLRIMKAKHAAKKR